MARYLIWRARKLIFSSARYFVPLLAADIITPDPSNPLDLAWSYTPIASLHDAMRWARETLHVVRDAPDDTEFLAHLTTMKMTERTAAGRAQYSRCYLLLRPDGEHALFLQFLHAIFDGRAGVVIARAIFADIVNAPGLLSEGVKHGQDVANLPLDIVHAVGEEKFRVAQRKGFVLPPEVRDSRVCQCLAYYPLY
jgi:hypothetical protein